MPNTSIPPVLRAPWLVEGREPTVDELVLWSLTFFSLETLVRAAAQHRETVRDPADASARGA